jgi:hypothetical protein
MHAPHSPSAIGPLSVAVPGEIAGLAHLHKKYGKLTWAECLAPAIKLCDEGFELNRDLWDVSFLARLCTDYRRFLLMGVYKMLSHRQCKLPFQDQVITPPHIPSTLPNHISSWTPPFAQYSLVHIPPPLTNLSPPKISTSWNFFRSGVGSLGRLLAKR